jgi:hypothetical protein
LLLIAAVAFAIVGSRPKLPAPIGPARNGLLAYDNGNGISLMDPLTGVSRVVPGTTAADHGPIWSPDGTMLSFVRLANGAETVGFVRPDGGDLRLIPNTDVQGIQQAYNDPTEIAWSSDSQLLGYESATDSRLHVINVPHRSRPRGLAGRRRGGLVQLAAGRPGSPRQSVDRGSLAAGDPRGRRQRSNPRSPGAPRAGAPGAELERGRLSACLPGGGGRRRHLPGPRRRRRRDRRSGGERPGPERLEHGLVSDRGPAPVPRTAARRRIPPIHGSGRSRPAARRGRTSLRHRQLRLVPGRAVRDRPARHGPQVWLFDPRGGAPKMAPYQAGPESWPAWQRVAP